MSLRESVIEHYLIERVEALGGTCEKFTSPNRRNVPDRLVCWPGTEEDYGSACFVECKAPGKRATPGQARDHERRRRMGFRVYVVDSFEAVDDFITSEGFE